VSEACSRIAHSSLGASFAHATIPSGSLKSLNPSAGNTDPTSRPSRLNVAVAADIAVSLGPSSFSPAALERDDVQQTVAPMIAAVAKDHPD
jgi:hypothetical protein